MRPSSRLLFVVGVWTFFACIIGLWSAIESALEWPSYFDKLYQVWLYSLIFIGAISSLDAISLLGLSKLSASRTISHNIAVGALTSCEIKVINPYARNLKIFINDHHPQHCNPEGIPTTIYVPGESNASIKYSVRMFHRGDSTFNAIRLLVFSKLQLWQGVFLRGEPSTVKVYPNFAAIHQYVLLSADQQTSQMGIKLNQKRGDGLEFHQLREYRIGDSLRQIDWRATSRLNKMISKEYQEEKDQNIIFLLDCGRRMRTKDEDLSHFDHSLNAMLLLSYIGLKQGDAVGFLSFGGIQRWMAPKKGTNHINTLLNQVYDCHPTLNASDFIEAATELNKRMRKRALVILISNIQDVDSSELLPAVKLLSKHHLLMIANLRENILDSIQEKEITSLDDALDYVETARFIKERNQLNESLLQKGVISIDSIPKYLAPRLVNHYFEVKRSGKL